MRLPSWLVDRLINRAQRTPYIHIVDYMERYWLVPFTESQQEGDGCGPVRFLTRPLAWCFQRLGLSVRLHHILRSDRADAWHDHPFDFLTLRLRGGYTERRPVLTHNGLYVNEEYAWHGEGSFSYRRCTAWHILELPYGATCWTLVIIGKRKQKWGFWDRSVRLKSYYKHFLWEHQERQ